MGVQSRKGRINSGGKKKDADDDLLDEAKKRSMHPGRKPDISEESLYDAWAKLIHAKADVDDKRVFDLGKYNKQKRSQQVPVRGEEAAAASDRGGLLRPDR